MTNTTSNINTADYWQQRYQHDDIGWDMGRVSPPLKAYFDNPNSNLSKADKDVNILIAGGGNAYEAQYLHQLGFSNVYVVDFAQMPLDNIRNTLPEFPPAHLIQSDFFVLDKIINEPNKPDTLNNQKGFASFFDFAIEQTFFCAISPDLRKDYVTQMHKLLKSNGKLVGVLWDCTFPHETQQTPKLKPPFGGNYNEYQTLFGDLFEVTMYTCDNSHPARDGKELFIEMDVK